MQAGFNGVIDCIKAFSETDHTDDLKKFDIATLIIHGDDDQIVPIGTSALLSSKIVKGATLKAYPGAPRGLESPWSAGAFRADQRTTTTRTSPWLQLGSSRIGSRAAVVPARGRGHATRARRDRSAPGRR